MPVLSRKALQQYFEWRGSLRLEALESSETGVDPPPAGAHELDEKRQVVHASVSFGEQLALDALQSPDGLTEEPAYLSDMPRNGKDLGAEPVAEGFADEARNGCLQFGSRDGERLDLLLRTLERNLQLG